MEHRYSVSLTRSTGGTKEERPHVTSGPRHLAPFPCEHCRLSLVAGFTSALPGLRGLYRPARRYLN